MKFLVIGKFKPGMSPDPKMVVAINEASKEWIKAHLADGSLDCAYNVLPSAAGYYGMGIANAASLEEANELLVSYPAYFVTDFELYPLSDVMKGIDAATAATRKMMGMMGK